MNAMDLMCIITYVAEMLGVNSQCLVVSCRDGWDWSIESDNDIISWDRDHINSFDSFVKYYEKEYLHIDK